ncbi:MAG: ABC transporter substrate-binding protein [Pseudoflavonifractor sp.]
MKNIWKRATGLLLATGMVLSLAACGPKPTDPGAETTPGTDPTPAAEKVVYSNGGPEEFFETPWLNPGTYMYNKTLYAHLIVADENLAPIPDHPDALATYEYSEDGKTLTFTLRDDAYWHDGSKITPEDIKWSIEYVAKTPVCNPVFMSTFKAIAGSDNGKADTFSGIAIDGQKITITFDKIAPDALLTFTQFAPVPKAAFEGVDPLQVQQAPYFQSPIGSGPFCIEEVSMKNFTMLKPFDQYYNGVAEFKIQLLPSAGDSDANVTTRAKSGQIDYAYTKMISDVQAIEGTAGVTVTPVDVRYTRLMYMNKFPKADGSPAPLADPKVRQAIRYAIDMQTICDTLFQGAAVPANSLIPGAADKASGLNDYAFNPEKSKELLAEAKWNPDTTIKVVYYYTDQATVDLMTAIQANLADVGIKMDFKLVEGDLATILWKAPADQTKGPSAVDWDMAYAANAALSLHEYYDRYRTGSPTNSHTPEDAKLNALIDATNASAKVEDQMVAFKELTTYENESLFAMALYYQPIFLITSDKIGDIKMATPQFNYDWDIQHWAVK